ncbi:MAG: TRAP transporter substrate-binding protein DctP [Halanaerobiales bacterium]|nr:TRAP transporter substrate-binding protein DctP [Halanaerobiales bacterium]
MRKIYQVMIFSLVAVMMFGVFNIGTVQAADYNWKFALEEIEGSVQHEWALEFARRMEEKSDGAVNIDIYPYGALGTSGDISEQTMNGILEFAFSTPSWFATTIPEAGLFSLHYIWSDNLEVNKYVMENSEAIYQDLSSIYNDKGLKLLQVFHEGWQVWTANKPIREPKDFEGVKIRVMGDPILIKNYQAYGANAVRLAYSEIYSSLQLNMIDAQVQPYFATQEMKFYEQQDYLIEAKQVPFITGVIINQNFFNNLSEEYQNMIINTSREMTDYIFEVQKDLNAKRLDMMLEDKPSLEVIRLKEEERQEFAKKAKTVWESYKNDVGENGAEILEKLLSEIAEAEERFAE